MAIRLKNLIVVGKNEAVIELGIFPRLLVHQCWMYIASLWSGARSWGSMHRERLHFIKAGAFLAQTKLEEVFFGGGLTYAAGLGLLASKSRVAWDYSLKFKVYPLQGRIPTRN